jgi:hypothetical protein
MLAQRSPSSHGRHDLRNVAVASLVVALLGSAACGSELGVGGSLYLDIAGLGVSPVPADGGTVTVIASGGQAAAATGVLSATGSWAGSLPDGDYMVDYMPPEGYKLVSSEVGSKATHVSAREVSQVSFSVSVDSGAIGTLALTVAGFSGACGAGRGSAVFQRTDVSQRPQTAAIPATGVDSVTVVAGTYAIEYNPASGYNTSSPTRIAGVTFAARGVLPAFFAVRAQSASLFIVADLHGPPWPTDGGSAMLLRTDTTGQVATTIPVYSTGDYYAEVSLAPGVYDVTYVPPTGFLLAGNAVSTVSGLSLCPADVASLTFPSAPAAGVRAR